MVVTAWVVDNARPSTYRVAWTRRRIAAAAVAIMLVAIVAVVALVAKPTRYAPLRSFSLEGNVLGATSLAAGRTFYVGDQVDPPRGPVSTSLDAVNPVVSDNSAGATVRVLLCASTTGVELADSVGSPRMCVNAKPFHSGQYRLSPSFRGDGGLTVVVAVTPAHAGHVHISGEHVRYHVGPRRGDQVTGIEVDTTTP